jgi:tetratricopeptide (TPR) repeat protein
MIPPLRCTSAALLGFAAIVATSACVLSPAPSAPGVTAIPQLEQRLLQAGPDIGVLVPLAAAYRDAGRLDDARQLLDQAHALDAHAASPLLYLGLVHEDLGNPSAAKRFYAQYLEVSRSPRLSGQVRSRLLALEHQALLVDVRSALAREAEIGDSRPDPSAVAVYPFLYAGRDPALKPLERALAEMLVVDLKISPKLRVLERTQVQLLLDEIQLAESGRVDPATAPRSGRLLGAGSVVQGRLDGTEAEFALQAAVIGVADPARSQNAPLVERDAARRLLQMQKRLALGVFRALDVTLTAEEQIRLGAIQTENLQALLLFGRGLEAFDTGRFADAARLFQEAASLDPAFRVARDYATRSAEISSAGETTTTQIGQAAVTELPPVPTAPPPVATTAIDAVQVLLPPPTVRSPTPEALGTQGIGRQSVLEIVLRRPQ